MESKRSKARAFAAVVLTAFGAGAAMLSMLVIWSGQPSGEPFEGDVLRWYRHHAGTVRFGDVLWIAGMAALIAGAALVAPWLRRLAARWYVAGMAVCAGLMIVSALIAFQLAGHAHAGTVSAADALRQWHLETSLFSASAFLVCVPVVAAAIGLDHERRFGSLMTTLGVIAAGSVAAPVAPWSFFAMLAWIVAMTAFAVHSPRQVEALEPGVVLAAPVPAAA